MNDIVYPHNRLGSEKSPYLLQHQNNPVWWYPWGEEAFEAARREDKPIFLSIGYATCYWCHVMEQDSFEQEDVARVLNEKFIAIKLDREERPDVDSLYMDAVMGMTGHGGWPMSVFMTADRVPFWGGTFFYRAQFLQVLEKLATLWSSDREKILSAKEQIASFLAHRSTVGFDEAPQRDLVGASLEALQQSFDFHYGGFGSKPKFPPTGQLSFLARQGHSSPDGFAHTMHDRTLDGMAKGGLFDHVGGGFARYSTDERWLVPHFEKMLYDNALLAVSYFEGWQLRKKDEYREIGCAILDFVLREMSTAAGGFSSALDAGDVGREGEFYVWADSELRQLLSEERYQQFSKVFSISIDGNFEAKTNVLAISDDAPLSARSDESIRQALTSLKEARDKRSRPFLDDKILSGWNGLALSALAKGFEATQDSRYKEAAVKAAEFMIGSMIRDNRILRRYREGDVRFNGCLEDYAYVVSGLLDLGIASEQYRFLIAARQLQDAQDIHLWDTEASCYRLSASDDLVVQKREFHDGALPSANAVSLYNLERMAVLFTDVAYRERALQLSKRFLSEAQRFPQEYCRFHNAHGWSQRSTQIVIALPAGVAIPEELGERIAVSFAPYRMILIAHDSAPFSELPILQGKGSVDGKLTLYVCDANGCAPPRHDWEVVIPREDAACEC